MFLESARSLGRRFKIRSASDGIVFSGSGQHIRVMAGPKHVPPSIKETAFNCPHCGALAKQSWFHLKADPKKKDELPLRLSEETFNRSAFDDIEDEEERGKLLRLGDKIIEGAPFIDSLRGSTYVEWELFNADLSRCFNCDKVAIWVQSALAYPVRGDAPQPNPDLPADIRLDFEEAGKIVGLSPRGAAALLRLAIQKLCQHLGETDSNIDQNIRSLVEKGLDVRIQRALDIVRVIGNEAVHPGTIDLRDDIETATKLFGLVNLIADSMISQPKHVEELYESLPPNKLAGIEARDKKAR